MTSHGPRAAIPAALFLFLTCLANPSPAEQPYRSPGTVSSHTVPIGAESMASPIVVISVEPAEIERGGTARLRWVVRHARRVLLEGEEIAPFGDIPVSPGRSTEYVIEAFAGGVRVEGRAALRVLSPPDPPSLRFYAVPSEIAPGDTTLLAWSAREASVVLLDGRRVDLEGFLVVRPEGPRRYEIEARTERASARAHADVSMRMPSPALSEREEARSSVDSTAIVRFDFAQSLLRDDQVDELAALAELMRREPDRVLRIMGHTDAVGAEAYNLALGRARAEAIRTWFVAQHGIGAARIRVESRGEAQPVAPNRRPDGGDHPAGRALNRRAELLIVSDPS